MNEQEFYQRLRERTASTPVPDTLSPDAVSILLKEHFHKASPKKRGSVATVLRMKRIWIPAVASLLLFCIFFQTDIRNQAVSDAENESADLVTVADAEGESADLAAETASVSDSIASPENYEQLYSLITTLSSSPLTCVNMEAPLNITQNSVTPESEKSSESPSQTFDTTDTDLTQTDGDYIYSAYSEQGNYEDAITISSIKNGVSTVCSTLSTDRLLQDTAYTSCHISDIYIHGSQLLLLGTITQNNTSATGILLYDVTDPTAPIFLHSLTQDGDYIGSHLADDCLYTFSSSRKKASDNPLEYQVYIPVVDDSILSCSDIYLPKSPNASCYQVMTGLKLTKPYSFLSKHAILSDNVTYDVSADTICFTQYDTKGNAMEKFQFSYQDGVITPLACVDLSEYRH